MYVRVCVCVCVCVCVHSSQVASMRGVTRQLSKLPSSNQPPQVILSKELVSPADVRFVSVRCSTVHVTVLGVLCYSALLFV